jgi:hypothetical protein
MSTEFLSRMAEGETIAAVEVSVDDDDVFHYALS